MLFSHSNANIRIPLPEGDLYVPISNGFRELRSSYVQVGVMHNRALAYYFDQGGSSRSPAVRDFAFYSKVCDVVAEYLVKYEGVALRNIFIGRTAMTEVLRAAGAFTRDHCSRRIVVCTIRDCAPRLLKILSDDHRISQPLADEIMRVATSAPVLMPDVTHWIRDISARLRSRGFDDSDTCLINVFIDVLEHSYRFWSNRLSLSGNGSAQQGEGNDVIIADGFGGIVGALICGGGGAAFFGAAASLIQNNPPSIPNGNGGTTGGDDDEGTTGGTGGDPD